MHQTLSQVMASHLADQVISVLTLQQLIHPHQTLGKALETVVSQLGITVEACDKATRALDLATPLMIGRLRRTELIQLARSITRFSRHFAANETCTSQRV